MKTIAVNGTTRYFDDEGEGPAVILVHGSVSSSRQWRKLIERLRGRHRLIAPDLYACAPGVGAAGAFTFVEDCDLVDRLIDVVAGKVHLVGHSYGGVIAIKLALARRERLASLTLIEPSCFQLLDQCGLVREFSEIADVRARQEESLRRVDLDASARGFVEYWMGPQAWAGMPEPRKALIRLGMPKVVQDWIGTFENVTRLSEYRSLNLPTLVMRARDTKTPSSRIVDLIGETLPNRILVEIDHGGHMSPITNPDPVNAAIEKFLEGL